MPFKDKEYNRKYQRAWYRKNRLKVLARSKELRELGGEERKRKAAAYMRLNRERFLSYKRLRLHRPDPGTCEICGKDGKRVRDHCHTTGKLRGAICNHCNWGLGHFKDNVELLQKASLYLKEHHPERH